ncbi:MAG: hypothetical protein MJZ52_05740 [Bacteroidales bacterium]|nr:hypothetical protein [Bacteroidales bacterium]
MATDHTYARAAAQHNKVKARERVRRKARKGCWTRLSVRHGTCGDTTTELSDFSFRRRHFLPHDSSPFRRSEARTESHYKTKRDNSDFL